MARCALIVLISFAACGDGPDLLDATADTSTPDAFADGAVDTSVRDSGDPDTAVADTTPDTTPSAPSCELSPTPGLSDHTLDHDGEARTYRLTIPTAHDGSAALPLVFDIHGYTETPDRQDGRSDFRAKAEAEGFILVQPAGTSFAWNAGGVCCGTAPSRGVDDVGFIRAIVADVSTQACVDPLRIYATGMSNGGFLSHRLACEASELFAAIAPVAGVLGVDRADCTPERSIPVMQVHGTADLIVPYDGSVFLSYPSVDFTIDHWVEQNACTSGPAETLRVRDALCETWSDCAGGAEVVLCTIDGGGHTWPAPSSGLRTTDAIWEFFTRHRLSR